MKSRTAKQRTNSKSSKKIYLSWPDYIELIKCLIDKIKKSRIKFDAIYGPCRGGYIPAVLLSHEINVPIIQDEEFWYELNEEKCKVIIIDDIVDTGETVKTIKETFPSINFYFSSIFKHKKCKFKPNFYMAKNDKWVVFPYEKD